MIEDCLQPERMGCRLSEKGRKRRSNLHHKYWPESRYQTALERVFRNLVENTVQLCICDHNFLHDTTPPPPKPSVQEMVIACTVLLDTAISEGATF